MSSQPVHEAVPVPGLYERLITTRLEQRIQELQEIGWHAAEQQVGDQSSPHVLARHIAETVRAVLASLPPEQRVEEANLILASLRSRDSAKDWIELIAEGPASSLPSLNWTRQEPMRCAPLPLFPRAR